MTDESAGGARGVRYTAATGQRLAEPLSLVAFAIGRQRYGIALDLVERILPMVTVSPLPGAPDAALGIINVHGAVVPVVDLRRRLGLPPARYGASARLLLVAAPSRQIAVPADEVLGVVEVPAGALSARRAVMPGAGPIEGIAALPDGLLLVHDPDAALSLDDEERLSAALREVSG